MTNHDGSFDDGGFDGNDGLEARLARLGAQPVDPATQSAHLTAMASARVPRRRLREKVKVAAALAGGFMLGSTGLAFAGALPAPVQDAASEAMAKVGVSAPVGTERYFGDGCAEGEDGYPRNRGLYLKQERAKGAAALAAAKASDCGRPLVSLGGEREEVEEVEETESEAGEAKPERCVDGEKVTGRSNGKGRSAGKGKSDAATRSTKPCETPERSQAPAGAPEAEADEAVEPEDDTPGNRPSRTVDDEADPVPPADPQDDTTRTDDTTTSTDDTSGTGDDSTSTGDDDS